MHQMSKASHNTPRIIITEADRLYVPDFHDYHAGHEGYLCVYL
jgi:hypothetical protein